MLEQHAWPGNVRELRNALKRAVALSRGAKILQAAHFAQLTELEMATLPPPAPLALPHELEFPPRVVAQAERMWKDGQLAIGDTATRQEHRAAQRAALLCLAVQRPFTSWPKALSQQWHRLFGDKWATTEEARGLRDMMRELGLDTRDGAIRGMVVELVGRRGERGEGGDLSAGVGLERVRR